MKYMHLSLISAYSNSDDDDDDDDDDEWYVCIINYQWYESYI